MASPQPGAFPRRDGERRGLLDRTSDYKFWVLAALPLLALWTMLTASVTLKRLAGGLIPGDSLDSVSYDDLNILEIEARESVVTHIREDAYRAGYESLASDGPGIRDAAIMEIARMSLRSSVSNDPSAVWDMVSEPSLAQILSCYGLFQSREFHDELISIPVSPSAGCCR